MSELAKAYIPKDFENEIYTKWEESGFFNPDNCLAAGLVKEKLPTFCVLMPPPNVTGVLHLGHALENSLMDIQARFHRLQGQATLFLPGADHAAVATQAKVEKDLLNQGYKNPRQELGRDKLLAKIKDYADSCKTTIIKQIRALGASCDWSRFAYTFDEQRSKVVNEVFKRMFQDGLIYRGFRVVNWSVKGQSTCSDDELEYVEQPTTLYTFKYSHDFPIPIATTRPETKLGDTAVAVHPEGKWKEYLGQTFKVDVGAAQVNTIKVIAEPSVDENYGTGAVGVTPAHSQIDYEMYLKNKEIGLIQVIGFDGLMTAEAGANYQGLTVLEARDKFVKWLKANDLLISEEPIVHNVSVSDRFKDLVEALPSTQWFIDVNKSIPRVNKSLKDLMREAVTVGHAGQKEKIIKIIPQRFTNAYLQWIDNLRDWCISRQIWWGHRIPVWYKGEEVFVGEQAPDSSWTQDEDTLDTWFSSGTWTFSTLQSADLKKFQPVAWMQMGYEILFFWLARMVLMTTYYLDDIPFKTVYIHGILRDSEGKKFSKSLNNGIDPLEIAEQYGTDALRLSLLANVSPGNDSRFYLEKVEHYRNFVNKLWNISRFILLQTQGQKIIQAPNPKTLADQWILAELDKTIKSLSQKLENYDFTEAINELYEFTWSSLADWYLEIAKIEKDKNEILAYLLDNLLKLWHPFCPFVTEAIWQSYNQGLLFVSSWPQARADLSKQTFEVKQWQEIIVTLRNFRSTRKIAPSIFLSADLRQLKINSEAIPIIERLARVTSSQLETGEKIVTPSGDLLVEIASAVAPEKLAQAKAELEKYISQLESKLKSEDFLAHAPAAVIKKEQTKLEQAQKKLAEL